MELLNRSEAGAESAERAVIDIGSNTVRLVVYGGPPRAPKILLNEKVTARLGRGVAEGGLLSEKARAAALTGLRRFALILRLRGVERVEAVATAAVRDAGNGAEFLDAVRALGLRPRLLSGEEEAVTSALGVAGAFPQSRGTVADLGGGSLELVTVDGLACEHGVTLPLGSLHLPALRAAGGASFSRTVARLLHGADWDCNAGHMLYLVGGSFRAFARYAIWQLGSAVDDPHGFELAAADALGLCRKLARARKPVTVPGLAFSRQASLPDTAALLSALLHGLQPARLVFSSWGLREGLLFQALPRDIQRRDPLTEGMADFVLGFGVTPAMSHGIADWTRAASIVADGQEERLRSCAIMLALAAQSIEPNMRAETAAGWALRKRWIGLDTQGRAAIAAALLANAGRAAQGTMPELPAPADVIARAQTWGLAVRLCRRFASGSLDALAASTLAREDGRIVLGVDEPLTALYTDPIAKDLRVLADMLGVKGVFAPRPPG